MYLFGIILVAILSSLRVKCSVVARPKVGGSFRFKHQSDLERVDA
jgi:hypothetical protein